MEAWLKYISKALCCVGIVLVLIYRQAAAVGTVWAIILVYAAAIACNGLAEHLRWKDNQQNPVTEAEATLLSRRTERHGRYSRKYFLKFVTADRSMHEFEVPYNEFDAYEMGDKGVLRYRTWEYLSFARGKELAEQSIPLPVESQQIEMYDFQSDALPQNSGVLTHELDE